MSTNILIFPRPPAAKVPARSARGQQADAEAPIRETPLPARGPQAPTDGRRRTDARSRSVEPNIQEIRGRNGKPSYRVQIRKLVSGERADFTRTFSTLALARKWKRRKLAEIEIGGVETVSKSGDTVADAIAARLATHKTLGRSARHQLGWLQKSGFGSRRLADLTQESLTDLADDMLAEDRLPQTVAGYLTILVHTLDWASRRKFIVPVAVLKQAMEQMWEDEILARSEERCRRPTIGELNAILDAAVGNKRQSLPLARIIVFAVFSCRRLGEICRLRWEDLRAEQKMILVRDMKHPRKKKGNDVWCTLTDEALAIILSMPRVGEFIFPFNARSIGTAWRRHRDRLEITDLRFHDLRHEGITRLFEMGKPAAFVAKHSGHKNGGCLFRYEHVDQEGDRFAGWSWTTWAADRQASGKMEK